MTTELEKAMTQTHILLVEDDPAHAEMIKRSLRTRQTTSIRLARNLRQCQESLHQATPDIVLLDLNLPDGRALDFIRESDDRPYPVLIMTAQGSEELAVEALKSGALDYLVKSVETLREMPRIIDRALREWHTRKQHEQALQALRESEARYRHLFQEFNGLLDAVPDSFMLIDPQLKILWANRAASNDAANAVSDLVDCYCYQVWYERTKPCTNCLALRAFETGQSCSDIVTLPDGRIFDCRAVPLRDPDGSVSRVINVKRDITEQKRLEEEADRAGRLAVLGELSAGLAHEINNPNALILYNSELLTGFFKDLSPLLTELEAERGADMPCGALSLDELSRELPHLLTGVHDAALRIKRIVTDLRDFSRQDLHDQSQTVDINQVAGTSARLVQNAISKATDHFRLNLADDLPPVRGVQGRLEQVVINLLLNACQALDNRSRAIELATEVVHDEETVTDSVKIHVRDEGTGIAPEIRQHLFEPFVTTKRDQGGTGLGLSVSLRIIREHKGTITFTSPPDQGTRVTVTLPVFAKETP